MTNLLLIPTPMEQQTLQGAVRFDASKWTCAVVGFGAIASGIETTRLINQHQPQRIILAGIAGLFQEKTTEARLPGSAEWLDRIQIEGIGVGQGDAYQDAFDLNWNWLPADVPASSPPALRCDRPESAPGGTLLSVTAASSDGQEARRRQSRFPDAIAEDMESFSVALACHVAGTPLMVARGYSNIVGRRDKSGWKIRPALHSVAQLLNEEFGRVD